MQGRSLVTGALVALALSAPAGAQSVRWNDRVDVDTGPETPTVRLWLEGTHTYSYGAPVRVWFNVSDDAYVVVARVDGNGHLTVLFPTSRTRTSEVKGGEDIQVRGRRGAATFYATDRMAGGFVFAMASYDPLDLSRLTSRDFDRYVTGIYVGRPTRVYVGDPHRIVSRFANLVLFSDQSPFDYAVDYYNVDAPYYVTSAGFSNFCNGYYGQYRRGLAERWDDEMYYGDGFGAMYNCGFYNYCTMGSPYGLGYDLYGMGFVNPLCFYPRSNQPTSTRPPVSPPGSDSARVPVWLTDSVRVGRPDTVGVVPERPVAELRDGNEGLRRGATVTTGPGRPISVGDDDPSGRSYAIPGRALRHSPTTFGGGRERDIGGAPGPDRISPATDGGSTITWVRPPREVGEGGRTPYGDGALPRRGRSGDNREPGDLRNGPTTFVTGAEGRAPVRAAPPRFDPPTRTYGPRFDAPPPSVRNSFDAPRYDRPSRFDTPRDNGASRSDPPRGDGGRLSPPMGGAGSGTSHVGDQVRASPTPPSSAPARGAESPHPPASTGEKKPPGGA